MQNEEDNATTLVQVSNSAAKLLKISAKAKKAGAVAPVMMAMVQTFQNRYSDQTAVSRVIELFLELRANTVQAQEDFLETHNRIIEEQDQVIRDQTKIFEDLVADEDLLEAHIAEMDTCYTDMCAAEDEARAKKANNEKLLEDSRLACETWLENYNDMKVDRQNELATISTLKELVEEKLNQFGGRATYGAADRGDTYQADWAEYENKYEYTAPEYV